MAGVELRDYQEEAVRRMRNGCILCGGVGSGKSRTSLAYYYVRNGGELGTDEYVPMDDVNIKDLYIITTARKRDTFEWESKDFYSAVRHVERGCPVRMDTKLGNYRRRL